MKVTFSPRAITQIIEIHDYIAERNPRPAAAVVDRIETLCTRLGEFPGLGTLTNGGVRVLPVVRYPYLIFYTVLADRDEVRILRVRHGARRPTLIDDINEST